MKEKNTEIILRIKDVISQEPKDIHTIAQEIKVEELSVLKATRELMKEGQCRMVTPIPLSEKVQESIRYICK